LNGSELVALGAKGVDPVEHPLEQGIGRGRRYACPLKAKDLFPLAPDLDAQTLNLTPPSGLKAGEILRSLVKAIIRTPEVGELKIDVRGDLAGILAISLKRKPLPLGLGFRKLRWLRA